MDLAQPEEVNFTYLDSNDIVCLFPNTEPDLLLFREVKTGSGKRAQLDVEARLVDPGSRKAFWANILVDCGCTVSCINRTLVSKHSLPLHKLPHPIRASNADGSANTAGLITEFVDLELEIGSPQGPHRERISLPVTNLGEGGIFLGHDWLRSHNPEIDWVQDRISFTRCPSSCSMINSIDGKTNGEYNGMRQLVFPDVSDIRAVKPDDLPEQIRDFIDVFDVSNFDHLPEHREWDHAINLKPGSPSQLRGRVYPLSTKEQAELDKFLDENLKSGRIRPSKSPYASVAKGASSDLRFEKGFRQLVPE
jgi:hypothetical protein